MRSASSPHDYCTCMFSAFDACSFCSALDYRCTYIRLEKHVCFASSYTNFDLLSLLLVLDLSLPHYLTSSVLQKLLDSRSALLLTCVNPEDYFCGTLDSATSLQPLGSTYTCIQLKIPGPLQKTGTACKLKPLSRPPSTLEPRDPTYMLGSLGLTRNTMDKSNFNQFL